MKKIERTRKTLLDMLHAINVLDNGYGFDVTVGGFDSVCVYAPFMLTPKGREHFANALSAETLGTVVCDSYEKNKAAWELISARAGYCSNDDFSAWFEGDDAVEL